MAAGGGFLGALSAVFGSLWRARPQKDVITYGSARWADRKDMERAGLFGDEGVFLGRYKTRYLRHDGPEHVMAFAPTRSGKGVGLVIPTLLSWTGSAVIHDIKGENWALTQRLARPLLPLSALRSDQSGVRALQSLAGSATRRT